MSGQKAIKMWDVEGSLGGWSSSQKKCFDAGQILDRNQSEMGARRMERGKAGAVVWRHVLLEGLGLRLTARCGGNGGVAMRQRDGGEKGAAFIKARAGRMPPIVILLFLSEPALSVVSQRRVRGHGWAVWPRRRCPRQAVARLVPAALALHSC